MKLIRIIRASEWWDYKMPPLLAIGYATLLHANKNIFTGSLNMLAILVSLVIGAAYVSTINDITDLKEDILSGKNNRIQYLPSQYRYLLPLVFASLGLIFLWKFYYPNPYAMACYLAPWMLFSLYSFPPLRLKNRGIWGALCDAGGSHIFTSLLMIFTLSFQAAIPLEPTWILSVAIWALCYGLRGILWHQYQDRDHDVKAGLQTVATRHLPQSFQKWEIILLLTECLALGIMLFILNNIWLSGALFLYTLLAYGRKKFLGQKPIIVLAPKNQPFQIILLDFIQVCFPITLLLYASFTQPKSWIILVIHLLLFPTKTRNMLTDVNGILRKIPSPFKPKNEC